VTEKEKEDERKAGPKATAKRQRTRKSIRTFLIYVVIFVALLAQLTLNVGEIGVEVGAVRAITVPSGSMKDTILVGDYLLVEEISIYVGGPHRGDIVTFHYPFVHMNIFERQWRYVSGLWGGDRGPMILIKRVVGEPGDTIEIKGGVLYVNGESQDEPYLKTDAGADFGPIKVPDGHYFMMGDNRCDSADSRYIGAAPRNVIHGKARVAYFSLAPTTCPKHGVPVVTTPDGKLRCPYDGEIMREGYDAVDASPLRLDKRIRWLRMGKVIY
jgi:signal peptidase I